MISSLLTKAVKSLRFTYKKYKNHVKDSLCPTEKHYGHLSQDCLCCMHSDFIFVSERCHTGEIYLQLVEVYKACVITWKQLWIWCSAFCNSTYNR